MDSENEGLYNQHSTSDLQDDGGKMDWAHIFYGFYWAQSTSIL